MFILDDVLMRRLSLLLLVLLLHDTLLSAGNYVIIVNKKMKTLPAAQIKAVYLKKLTVVDGIPVVPLNLGVSDPLRASFEKELLNMGHSRLQAYWTRQHYLGHRPPLNLSSQKSVKSFVQKVEGAIGYIDAAALDNSVKAIYRWND